MTGSDPAPDDSTPTSAQVPWESMEESAAGRFPDPPSFPSPGTPGGGEKRPAVVLSGFAEDDGIGDDFDFSQEAQATARIRGGGWTIPLLCAGIALIACCVLIPQADANRRLAYERAMLQADLESIEKQVAVNDQFLKKVADDPELAERLAQRQMKIVRAGTRVLDLKDDATMSPFQLVTVAPPPPLPPYRPIQGALATLCYDPRSRLYLSGGAMIMIAMGLVLGYAPKRP